MSRPIDADVLMATLGITDMDCDKCAWGDKEWRCCKRGGDFEDACCAIENAPTIETRNGKWIFYERREQVYDLMGTNTWANAYRCSECGFIHTVIEDFGRYVFCPSCGADMRGEEDALN